jgi:hypothetical protein
MVVIDAHLNFRAELDRAYRATIVLALAHRLDLLIRKAVLLPTIPRLRVSRPRAKADRLSPDEVAGAPRLRWVWAPQLMLSGRSLANVRKERLEAVPFGWIGPFGA